MQESDVITKLVISVESLLDEQSKTREQLKDISISLAVHESLTQRVDLMDREIAESFRRVHKRIDSIARIQDGDTGCNSLKLLTKDVNNLTKDVIRLLGVVEDQRLMYENLKSIQDKSINPAAIKWVAGIIIAYSVTFGTYVVQSFAMLEKTNAKLVTKLDRDVEDTKLLTNMMRDVEKALHLKGVK